MSKNSQRSILKQALTGQASRSGLLQALRPASTYNVFTYTPDGRHSGGGHQNLTEEAALSLAAGQVVFLLPDNGR